MAMSNASGPIRVLQINSGDRNFGGVSSFLYNVYLHIDRRKVQFDFLSPYHSTYGIHEAEILQMGGRVIELGIGGNKLLRKLKLYPSVKAYLKRHPYGIVHINSGNFFFNLIVSRAVADAGVERIIVHSHSADNPESSAIKKKLINRLKPVLSARAKARYACSAEAARFMFSEGPAVDIIRNGIEINRFQYDEACRTALRRQMNLEDKHVLGHVGRFLHAKNQPYLIRIMEKLAAVDPRAVLLLLGDGEEMDGVRDLARRLNLSDRVLFLGTRTDVEKYYQVMDAFAFPSVWEGLGMVMIEAQISGLHCVASTGVPRETDITGNVTFLDTTDASIDAWVEAIEKAFRAEGRGNRIQEAMDAGYEINSVASDLAKRYQIMLNGAQN